MAEVGIRESITFKLASKLDLDVICINENKAYSIPWSTKSLLESINGDHFVFVMKYKEQEIGHMIIQQILDETHLLNVCVIPDFQGRGMGKVWIKHLLAFANQQASVSLFLEVRLSNHNAIKLYTQSGFKRLATRKGYYRTQNSTEDGLVMELKL